MRLVDTNTLSLRQTAVLSIIALSVSGAAGCVSAPAPLADASPRPTLETFRTDDAPCYDRSAQPETSVVDTHVHLRPFGGQAIPFEEVMQFFAETGVLFANVYGIGQMLPASSACTYYLDCPGTLVVPTLKNDFVNAAKLRDEGSGWRSPDALNVLPRTWHGRSRFFPAWRSWKRSIPASSPGWVRSTW